MLISSLRLKGIEYLNFMADMYEVDNATRQQRIQELSETFEMQNALNDKNLILFSWNASENCNYGCLD